MEYLESKAFQRATLRSELYRISGLLCLLGVLTLYAVARGVAAGQTGLLAAQVFLLLLAIAYEARTLTVVKRALQSDTAVSRSTWLISVFVETQLPTLAIFILITSGIMSHYQALVAPALLVYFFFIILSTLRLSPGLSILSGLLSAMGYLGVIAYATIGDQNTVRDAAAFPLAVYFIYAVLILASGGVAAFVAGQIRAHVAASLREAELKSELERVNHDLEIARSIQQGLLPTRSPKFDGFEIAGWNESADETGGDYFDWQELPDGRLAVSLADATGHGIGPALVGVSCRAYARASLIADGKDNGVLGRLNSLLAEDLESNRFVTFAVIFLDPKSSAVQVLSAGHGPILWYRYASDQVESLEAQGIPLGIMDGFNYDEATEGEFGEGDFLALVTDGFFEWENPEGEDFGVARMEAVLRDARDLPADEMIRKLRAAVADFCQGTKQMDDLTAVVLKRKRPVQSGVTQ